MTNGVVLIADSDPTACERYELALSRAGFSVVSTADGTSALRLASRLVPDDLLTEILLPNLDGFHLAQRLRKQAKTSHIGIVAVTSYEGDDLRQRAAESGIDAVLRKTRSTYDIVRAVRATTLNSRALTERAAMLRLEVDIELDRGRELGVRARAVLAESRQVVAQITSIIGADGGRHIEAEMLEEADGARDVMMVDRTRGEALFQVLFERYGDQPLLRYKRGEAYRGIGRRKLAHQEFVLAADRLPQGVWRERARFAAMRTRSHHEPSK